MRSRTGNRRRDRIEQEALQRRARANHHLDRVRNRRSAPRRSLPGRAALVPLALIGALVLGVWIGDDAIAEWAGSPWKVEDIEVLGAERLSAAEVAQAADVARGDDYRHADPERLARRLAENAWVAEARATRLPGGTVVLGVREREPLAVIDGGGGPLGVDAEGRPFAVLDPREAEGLPRLRCKSTPPPGEADARLAEAIRVGRSLPERGLAMPTEIALGGERDPEGLVLRLPGIDARFVLGAEDFEARIAAMAELLAKRPEEVAQAAQVDLRFAGQAVLQEKADSKGSA